MRKGRLIAVCGPMFAGKTTLLIKEYGEGRGVVIFKPDLDRRFTKRPVLVTHDGEEIPSVLVNNDRPEEMLELVGEVDKVLVDEVNFFGQSLVAVVEELLARGKEVWVAGLDRYADGEPWGSMPRLKKLADRVYELTARCDGEGGKCREPAVYSYFKKPNMEKVTVAGVEEYGAACAKHHKELHQKSKTN